MAKAKQKRMRQKELPGMEKPRFPEIERAAENYRELREEQKAALDNANAAKERLIDAMRKHGQTSYRDDNADPPIQITLEAKDAVKLVEVRPAPRTDLEARMEIARATDAALGAHSAKSLERMARANGRDEADPA